VRRHLRELADAGLIVKVRHGGGRNRLASVFQVTMPSCSGNFAHQRAEKKEERSAETSNFDNPNSAHGRAGNLNPAHHSAHYSAHRSTPTTLTTLTSNGKDFGEDHQPEVGEALKDQNLQYGNEHRASMIIEAVRKIVDGNGETFQGTSGWNYAAIPFRFFAEEDGCDDESAANRLLSAAVEAIESTDRVTDGLAYLCNARALTLSDAAFLVRVVCADRDPFGFTKVTDGT
jgi:hypothetical protein